MTIFPENGAATHVERHDNLWRVTPPAPACGLSTSTAGSKPKVYPTSPAVPSNPEMNRSIRFPFHHAQQLLRGTDRP